MSSGWMAPCGCTPYVHVYWNLVWPKVQQRNYRSRRLWKDPPCDCGLYHPGTQRGMAEWGKRKVQYEIHQNSCIIVSSGQFLRTDKTREPMGMFGDHGWYPIHAIMWVRRLKKFQCPKLPTISESCQWVHFSSSLFISRRLGLSYQLKCK